MSAPKVTVELTKAELHGLLEFAVMGETELEATHSELGIGTQTYRAGVRATDQLRQLWAAVR